MTCKDLYINHPLFEIKSDFNHDRLYHHSNNANLIYGSGTLWANNLEYFHQKNSNDYQELLHIVDVFIEEIKDLPGIGSMIEDSPAMVKEDILRYRKNLFRVH